jgi:hypothetical protein
MDNIRKLCNKIIRKADKDEYITIAGNDVNTSEARVVAEEILRLLDGVVVWYVEWNNGQDYEDNYTEFVGVYSTKAKAEAEAIKFHEGQLKAHIYYNNGKADWYVTKIKVNE